MVETPASDTLSSGRGDRFSSWLFSGASGPRLVAICGFAAFVAVLSVSKIFDDGDTYWHLATGDWILNHRAIPTTDPFSYTFAGAPWQAHEWLSEVLMALVFRAGGWSGLALLFAAAVGGRAWLNDISYGVNRVIDGDASAVIPHSVFSNRKMGLKSRDKKV